MLVVLACHSGSEGKDGFPTGPQDFNQTDSAGVIISTTRGGTAWTPLHWEIDSLPELVIGAGETTEDVLFKVEGGKSLQGGGVMVVDGGSREIRFFDSRGRPAYHVGGRGQGPGEFEDPHLLPLAGSDSLILWDGRLRRFQMFSSDGRNNRVVQVPDYGLVSGMTPVGAVGHSLLLREWEPFGIRESGLHGAQGPLDEGWQFFWLDTDTGELRPAGAISFVNLFGVPGGATAIPFTVRPSVIVNERGLYMTDGRSPEVLDVDLEGKTRRIFRIDGPLRPVTSEIFEVHIQQTADLNSLVPRGYWREVYGKMEVPDSLPVFQSLKVDDLGWVWAEVFQTDWSHAPEWLVLDPSGRASGIVRTPVGLEVLHLGSDFILGLWRDELGVEYVHRYGLRRRAVPAESSDPA